MALDPKVEKQVEDLVKQVTRTDISKDPKNIRAGVPKP